MVITFILLSITVAAFFVSLYKDKGKTKKSFQAAGNMLKSMALELVSILAFIALMLALIPEDAITNLLGNSNRLFSTLAGAFLGTVTIIPGVIAFPMAQELLAKGAWLTALAGFITTLTMVGFATAPIEIRHFGKRFTYLRNSFSFLSAIAIAVLLGFFL
ncbi:MAG: permease [Spirochaetia bacterium]